jgi:hypothetical protein
MLKQPWKYKESIAICAALFAIGILLQFTVGQVNLNVLAFPVNIIVLITFIAILIAVYLFGKEIYLFRWMATFEAAVPAMAAFAALMIIMGLIPQINSETNIYGIIGRAGFMSMLSSWYFALICAWFILILGMVIVKKARRFNIKKDIPFLLNHLGLLIALLSGTLGSPDIKRLQLTASLDHSQWQALDINENTVKLPFSIKLNQFTIDEYPPKLMLVNNVTGAIISEGKQNHILVENNLTEGTFADWHITINNYFEYAAPIFTEDTMKYVAFHSTGATCALHVIAINLKTQQQRIGWVSCGSFMFPYNALQLDERLSLVMPEREPRRYASDITVFNLYDKKTNAIIEVNKPLKVDGWKIYQLSYDVRQGRWSTISVFELVKDPWLSLVYVGILMMIAGALSMFIFATNKKEDKT